MLVLQEISRVLFFIVLINKVNNNRVAPPVIISSESEGVFSSIETNIKEDNITETDKGLLHHHQSSSISAEHPLEDYIDGKDLKIARRPTYGNWWDACYVKAEKFCMKQCRRALYGVCKRLRGGCRSSLIRYINSRCHVNCQSTFTAFYFLPSTKTTMHEIIVPVI